MNTITDNNANQNGTNERQEILLDAQQKEMMHSTNTAVDEMLKSSKVLAIMMLAPELNQPIALMLMRKWGTKEYYMSDCATDFMRTPNPYISLVLFANKKYPGIGIANIGLQPQEGCLEEAVRAMKRAVNKTKL
jgi:hypothetical protein